MTTMRSPWLFWLSVVLVLIGLAGVAWLSVAIPPAANNGLIGGRTGQQRPPGQNFGSGGLGTGVGASISNLGERIFRTGEGENGPVPRSAVGPGMMGGGCADCHGSDGRGRNIRFMMGDLKTPDIRLSTLLKGGAGTAWTRQDVGRAIRDGVEPNGQRLDEFMPRWRLTDAELNALLDYMEGLN